MTCWVYSTEKGVVYVNGEVPSDPETLESVIAVIEAAFEHLYENDEEDC